MKKKEPNQKKFYVCMWLRKEDFIEIGEILQETSKRFILESDGYEYETMSEYLEHKDGETIKQFDFTSYDPQYSISSFMSFGSNVVMLRQMGDDSLTAYTKFDLLLAQRNKKSIILPIVILCAVALAMLFGTASWMVENLKHITSSPRLIHTIFVELPMLCLIVYIGAKWSTSIKIVSRKSKNGFWAEYKSKILYGLIMIVVGITITKFGEWLLGKF